MKAITIGLKNWQTTLAGLAAMLAIVMPQIKALIENNEEHEPADGRESLVDAPAPARQVDRQYGHEENGENTHDPGVKLSPNLAPAQPGRRIVDKAPELEERELPLILPTRLELVDRVQVQAGLKVIEPQDGFHRDSIVTGVPFPAYPLPREKFQLTALGLGRLDQTPAGRGDNLERIVGAVGKDKDLFGSIFVRGDAFGVDRDIVEMSEDTGFQPRLKEKVGDRVHQQMTAVTPERLQE